LASSYILTPEDYYRNFKQAIKAKETFNSYDQKLKTFMKYKGVSPTDFASLIQDKDTRQIEADVINFIISLKEKHYSLRSQDAYLSALIHFYSINDVIVITCLLYFVL
jgi:site-specific recombinase XerD